MTIPCLVGDFHIVRPKYTADHQSSVKWLAAVHASSEANVRGEGFDEGAFRRSMERHITRFGCGPESLAFRGFELEDFLHQDWERMRIFNTAKHPHGAGMTERMEVFAEIADSKLEAFYPTDLVSPPEEIIHVSCTGYVAPSAVQKLVVKRGWQQHVGVIHAYHMGCYASMPALRMASAFIASPRVTAASGRRIDIVHTEQCSLHLDPGRHVPEQLVVQSLFSDGHIRYSVSPDEGGSGLRLLGLHEEIIPDSSGAIGWVLGDHGMRMMLSRDVPDLIAANLKDFLKRLFANVGVDGTEALSKGLFAIHPGGPRIIDKVAQILDLQPWQVAESRAVLKAFGNMSSATLPHVWANLLADRKVESGTLIPSLAFGPGLTVFGAVFRKI